jgi:hypothetical protein
VDFDVTLMTGCGTLGVLDRRSKVLSCFNDLLGIPELFGWLGLLHCKRCVRSLFLAMSARFRPGDEILGLAFLRPGKARQFPSNRDTDP